MRVLSLFNGMSCGNIALNQTGIFPEKYYSSEIDKEAIRVTQINFPDTIQLGDITKWIEWDIDFKSIDLVLAGSPCQGFSFAGKQLAFDDPRSKLFFVFVDILNHIKALNPNVKYLLENVYMAKEHENVINKILNINPIKINSALVSAQNRKRNYWTNINTIQSGLFGHETPNIPQPKDMGIFLKDILESDVNEKYYISDKMMNYLNTRKDNYNNGKINYKYSDDKASCINASSGAIDISDNIIVTGVVDRGKFRATSDKSQCIDANYFKGADNHGQRTVIQINQSKESGGKQPYQQNRVYDTEGSAPALCKDKADLLIVHNMMPRSSKKGNGGTGHLTRKDGKTYCLDTVNTNAVEIVEPICIRQTGRNPENPKSRVSGLPTEQMIEQRNDFKTGCLSTVQKDNMVKYGSRIRRLTPGECCALQNVPKSYFFKPEVKTRFGNQICSDSAIYKMLGNGWTINVIVHILRYL